MAEQTAVSSIAFWDDLLEEYQRAIECRVGFEFFCIIL
jgi:hypothetical protein